MLNRTSTKPASAKDKTERGVGIVKGNPRRCLFCLKPIGEGEAWTKYTSRDLEYTVIVHDRCNGKG